MKSSNPQYIAKSNGNIFTFVTAGHIKIGDFSCPHITLSDNKTIICVKLKYLEENFTKVDHGT